MQWRQGGSMAHDATISSSPDTSTTLAPKSRRGGWEDGGVGGSRGGEEGEGGSTGGGVVSSKRGRNSALQLQVGGGGAERIREPTHIEPGRVSLRRGDLRPHIGPSLGEPKAAAAAAALRIQAGAEDKEGSSAGYFQRDIFSRSGHKEAGAAVAKVRSCCRTRNRARGKWERGNATQGS